MMIKYAYVGKAKNLKLIDVLVLNDCNSKKEIKEKEDYRVKYIRSIENVLRIFGPDMKLEDRDNLNRCIGSLFSSVKFDNKMTKELAKELGLEYLQQEV